MRNFVKKYYIQLIAIAMLFAVVVFMLFESFNISNIIKDKSKELKQIQLDYILAHEFLQHSYEFKKNAEYIDNGSEWISILLPNNDENKVQLFSALERLADDTGNNSITLSVVKAVEKTKQKKDVETEVAMMDNTLKMNVTLVGNYDDLIYFLEKIENIQYFANVSTINVEKTAVDTKNAGADDVLVRDDLLKTTMTITFYLDNK